LLRLNDQLILSSCWKSKRLLLRTYKLASIPQWRVGTLQKNRNGVAAT
jgi:hypothetical protein